MIELFELTTRILADTLPPAQIDGAYLYAQTTDNEQSVFSAAKELVKRQLCTKLLVADSPPRNGYPGYDHWRARLVANDVPAEMIVPVPTAEYENLNTRTEAQALVAFAKAQNIRDLFIVAAPFHQVRAFMSVVTIAIAAYPELRLFNFPGPALPWLQSVLHSQGTVIGNRNELLAGELERIENYGTKGDLTTPRRVLEYLNSRG